MSSIEEGAKKNGMLPSDLFISTGSGDRNEADPSARYYSSSGTKLVAPYKSDGGVFSLYTGGSYANADFSGKSNTTTIVTNLGANGGQAAKACSQYSTNGTSIGDWYLPAVGELGYMMVRLKTINNALTACSGTLIRVL